MIFFFPFGFLMMWSSRCRFPRLIKSVVSLAVVGIVVMVAMPQMQPPGRTQSGVEVVSRQPASDFYGPLPPDNFETFEAYSAYEPPPLVVEPTPTPVPVYVYCNDGGKYYHTEKCRYTKSTTPKVKLSQALNAGYQQCGKCSPPVE